MHKAVAFKRTTMSEPPVAEQLDKYLRKTGCRVIGFQVVKEKPEAVEEYLLAVVEEAVPKYLIRESGESECLL